MICVSNEVCMFYEFQLGVDPLFGASHLQLTKVTLIIGENSWAKA